VLKTTLPGVPDFYRGTELWDFNLVDPDNRRPVDYDARRKRLDQLRSAAKSGDRKAAREVVGRWPDPALKLWTTAACLAVRRDYPDLFAFGEYLPLTAEGKYADHIISFARRHENEAAIIVVPRNLQTLIKRDRVEAMAGMPRIGWQDTRVAVPDDFPGEWQCRLSGEQQTANSANGVQGLLISQLLNTFPVAVLNLR
jgi:(1->4)-alpha-D-glucan 1-alpha-D-glucosylmutase